MSKELGFEYIRAPVDLVWPVEPMATIIYSNFLMESGLKSFTDPKESMQVLYMRRPNGHVIPAHTHVNRSRSIPNTQEILFVRKGLVNIDFYLPDGALLCSRFLSAGDFVVLAWGGHGLEMLQDTEIVEVKQGPYQGRDADKIPIGEK